MIPEGSNSGYKGREVDRNMGKGNKDLVWVMCQMDMEGTGFVVKIARRKVHTIITCFKQKYNF